MVVIGRLQCAFDDRIMTEYREVLSRPKFRQAVSDKERREILGHIAHSGIHVLASPLGREATAASDPDDVPFVEVAVASGAELIITGNMDHFSFFVDNEWGIRVVSPRKCYELFLGR